MESDQRVDILLVDDQENNLIALETVLSSLNQNLVTARSGKEALRKLLDREFAVIVLDVAMPEMNGFETATLIRRREKTRLTPIIFLTAAPEGDEDQAYALGAVDFICKPFKPSILEAKVTVFVDLFRKTLQIREREQHIREMERIEYELRLSDAKARAEAEKTLLEERSRQLQEASTLTQGF